MAFYVYILASRRNGTLYIGHTDSISRRIWQHQDSENPSFTHRYEVNQLVYYEVFETRSAAFRRERDEEVAAPLEARADRAVQSGLAGPERGPAAGVNNKNA